MTITFEKKGSMYVAETSVSGDFAVHAKLKGKGIFTISKSVVDDGEYAKAWSEVADGCYDRAFKDGVYPLYLRITSTVEVENAVIVEAS